MKTWNFGVVGAGVIAGFHAAAINEIKNAKLLGFFDNISERANNLAGKYSSKVYKNYDQMLSDPEIDVITIATPTGAHADLTIAAAKAGKHVICEKPLEVTLQRIDSIIEAHKKAGTLLGCVFQNHFTDAMKPLRNAIAQGRFGRITYAGVYVPWWRSDEYYKDSWHGTWKLDGGGALMNQSIHMIDMLCDLMPPVESVQAFTATLAHKIETEDTAAVILRFTNNALGIIYGATSSYPGQFKRFEITGTKGTVIYTEEIFTVWQFADEQPQDQEIRERFGTVKNVGAVADHTAISHENHKRNFKAYLEALESGKEFELNGYEGRKAVELILAIYQSAREQKLIKLI